MMTELTLISLMQVFLDRVLDSPSWIWDLPPRGKSFCLHGIDPLRLHTDYSKDKVDLK